MAESATTASLFTSSGGTPLDGFFKRRYAARLQKYLPTSTKLQKLIGFNTAEPVGDEYHMPVELQLEHGVTYAGPTEDGFDLAGSVAGATKTAKISGSQHVLQTRFGYKALSASQTNEQAFETITKNRIRNMWVSIHKRLEIDLLYGQKDLGIVDTAGYAADTNLAGSNSGTSTITISAASWAPLVWAGMVGAPVQVFATFSGGLPGAQRAYAASANTAPTIVAIDVPNRKLVLSQNVTGCVATDVILLKGMTDRTPGDSTNSGIPQAWKTMIGLAKMAQTTSGSLFNISTDYDQWKAIPISVGSTDFSFPAALDGAAEFVNKGGDGDLVILVSPKTQNNMISNEAARRKYDASYEPSKFVNGAKDLVFNAPNGQLTIVSHGMVKQGEAYGFNPEELMRLGSTDITFDRGNMPQVKGAAGTYFHQLENKAAYELQAYSDQALFTEAPAHIIYFSGIVNS